MPEQQWSPNRSKRPAGAVPRVVILHSTGGSYDGALSWMMSKKSKVSAHYLVARDGRVRKLVPTSEAAWHAGIASWRGVRGVNGISIGIEMEHLDGKQDWPPTQIKAVAHLVQALRDAIPSIEAVCGHCDVAPRRKVDPVGFDFAWVR